MNHAPNGGMWSSDSAGGMMRAAAGGLVAALVLGACAGNTVRREPTIDYRTGGGAARSSAPDWVRDPTAVSSSPAVQEAAALAPESRSRPGGSMRQAKDDPRARAVTVQRGDSLYKISTRYSVNVRALIETNRLSPPYPLEVGQVIYLPPPNVHVIAKGETLYGVSRRYNVDTRSLAVMNGLKRPWTVYPGDELMLPALARDNGRAVAVASASRPSSAPARPAAAPAPLKEVKNVRKGDFIWPVEGKVLQGFGETPNGLQNDGVNISAERGANVVASAAGEVVYVGDELTGFGNLILLSHEGGWISAYAHAERVLVSEGQKVSQGEAIALAGATGSAQTPQVHFELRRGRQPVDPAPLISG